MHTHRTSHGSFASSRLPRARPRAPPARSSPGSARRRDPDARIHPCPLASLPRHGSLARAFHRRDARAESRPSRARANHSSIAFERERVTYLERCAKSPRARSSARSSSSTPCSPSRARVPTAGRERMGARRCGDEDECLTVYAHECMWMTSIVVFISDVWNILSSYICFL